MGYISNSDIELRLGSTAYVQLTDDEGTGSANTEVVAEARLGAEGEVNSYLARRHRVPIDLSRYPELAALLATATLDVVEYRLHARRPPVPDDVGARYRGVLDWLAQVAGGQASLPAATPLPANDAGGLVAQSTGNAAVLSREELESL